MDFEIIARHLEITPEMKTYVDSRLGKLPKFFGRIHGLKAVLVLEGDIYQVELVANLVKGDIVVARATDRDVYAAVDSACDKLESQLRRYKDRLREHRVKAEAEQAVSTPAEETQEEGE